MPFQRLTRAMYRLNTLGTLELVGLNPAEAGAILAQPKRLGLLLYLSLGQPAGWQRRDTLLGLLWGESDQSRARNALSQALHHLRRGLGADTIPGQGVDLVRVEPALLPCDAVEFEELARQRKFAEALALYRGDLLPGFFVDDAPEFERWLEGERQRFRDLAFTVATAVAQEREAAGDLSAAAEALRRAAELRPEDEGIVRHLMQLLDQTGDRGSALRAYEKFAEHLRSELEVEPSRETQALAHELRSRAAPDFPAPDPAPPISPPGALPAAAVRAVSHAPSRRIRIVTLILLAVIVVTGGQRLLRGGDSPSDGTPDLIAIAPFRLSGADPALSYLREGMVDLLAAKLSGEQGPRAMDPRAILAAWRGVSGAESGDLTPETAITITNRMGAKRLVLGGVVGRPDRLMINASLRNVPGGRELARASVEGPADSLPEMVDRLAAQLLAIDAGEAEQRLTSLSATSLAALRPYLAGQVAYRAGRYEAAVMEYQRALQADSSFTLASLGLAAAGVWVASGEAARRVALAKAWAGRDRLKPADRAYLIALAGPRYPAEPTARERLDAWEKAAAVAPDRPDVWYEYGDILFHKGALLGIGGAWDIARNSFEKAFKLDSTYAAASQHLFEILVADGDTAAALGLGRQLLLADTTAEHADFLRWRMAVAGGDSSGEAGGTRSFDAMNFGSLWRIIGTAQLDGVGMADADRAATELARRPSTVEDRIVSTGYLAELALNRGRPRAAAKLVAELPPDDAARPIIDALFADGDTLAALATARTLALTENKPLARDSVQSAFQLFNRCALIEWRLWRGDSTGSSRVLADLSAITDANSPWWAVGHLKVCQKLIDGLIAANRQSPAAGEKLAALDSVLQLGLEVGVREPGNLASARLHEQLGDPAGALAALRRREYHHRTGIPFLAYRLRHQARLASQLGEKEEAGRAARQYLILRGAPGLERAAVEDSIKQQLTAISGSP